MGIISRRAKPSNCTGQTLPISPIESKEAVEQMVLLGHDFFVFYDPARGQVNVVYKRSDDQYGVIDPELS